MLEKGWGRDRGLGRGAVLSGGALGVGGEGAVLWAMGQVQGVLWGGGGRLAPRTAASIVACRLEQKLDNHNQHSLVVIVIFRASQEKTARHISDAPAAFIHNDMSRYNPQHIFLWSCQLGFSMGHHTGYISTSPAADGVASII